MIVDTSALMAITLRETGCEPLEEALAGELAIIPAPVLVEFNLVSSGRANEPNLEAQQIIARLLSRRAVVEPFATGDAELSVEAHRLHGRGNGLGGKLNLLDIMVYCMAKRLGRPILCTGRDFAATDAAIHPASRIG